MKLIKFKTILISNLWIGTLFHSTPTKSADRPASIKRLENCTTQCLICSIKFTRLSLPACKAAIEPSRFDPLCRRTGQAVMRLIDATDNRLALWEQSLTAPVAEKMD